MFRRGITIVAGAVLVGAMDPINAPLVIVIFVAISIMIIALYPYNGGKFLP